MDLDRVAEQLAAAFSGAVAEAEHATSSRPPWLEALLELHRLHPAAHPYTLALALQAAGWGSPTGREVAHQLVGDSSAAPAAGHQQRPPRPTGKPVKVDGLRGWLLPGKLPAAATAHVVVVDPNGASQLVQRKRVTAARTAPGH
jgi:hypothetical protein